METNLAEIKELPNTGFAPTNCAIAKHLREQADWIEADDENVRNVFMVIERADGTIYRQTMGQTCDLARALGVLAIACIRGAMGDDA